MITNLMCADSYTDTWYNVPGSEMVCSRLEIPGKGYQLNTGVARHGQKEKGDLDKLTGEWL